MLLRRKTGRSLILLTAAVSAWPAGLRAEGLAAGTYVAEHRSGILVLSKVTPARLHFAITAVSANGNLCDIEGDAPRKGPVVAFVQKDCSVTITTTGEGAEVNSTCPEACGANVYMDGLYRATPQACSETAVAKRRKDFAALYQTKRYQEAASGLEDLPRTCGFFLERATLAWTLNDLALAAVRSGDKPGCKAWLDQLAVLNVDEGRLKLAGATNRGLCSALP